MSSAAVAVPESARRTRDTAVLACLGLATLAVHLAVGGRYGFHRDELALLDDARQLSWGYVAYPPVAPFFARLSLILFGTSLAGFRLFAALAQAVLLVLAGLIAREMGARRRAQLVAAAAAVPFSLAAGALMQYVSFDNLCWVLVAYFVVRLCASDDQRWWAAIGAAIGLGMLAKYGMGFFVAGVVGAVLLTERRRDLRSKWLWLGVALSLVIFLPNLLWEAQHHFISLDFLRAIHERDVRIGRTRDFLPEQLEFTLLAAPLWIAGLWALFFDRALRRFRMLAWMYVIPLLLLVLAKGRGYYLTAAYPMLYAAGALWGERRLARWRTGAARAVRGVVWLALLADMALVVALILPVAPVGSAWFRTACDVNGDLREEFGWPELAQEVARIRDSLAPGERLGIIAGNYGEAGAIDLYGPQYGLPRALSGTNSYWAKGYGDPPPQTLIVVGLSQQFRDAHFESCRLAGHTWNAAGVPNEETKDHPDIYLCRGVRPDWPAFWTDFRRFS
jgi:hypothetical protein